MIVSHKQYLFLLLLDYPVINHSALLNYNYKLLSWYDFSHINSCYTTVCSIISFDIISPLRCVEISDNDMQIAYDFIANKVGGINCYAK